MASFSAIWNFSFLGLGASLYKMIETAGSSFTLNSSTNFSCNVSALFSKFLITFIFFRKFNQKKYHRKIIGHFVSFNFCILQYFRIFINIHIKSRCNLFIEIPFNFFRERTKTLILVKNLKHYEIHTSTRTQLFFHT